MRGGRAALVVVLFAVVPLAARAQQGGEVAGAAGAQFERQGRLEEAARAYRAGLDSQPANVGWLFGLERVLDRLGRLQDVRPYLARAVDREPRNEVIREAEFRVAQSLYRGDSLAAVAARWIAAAPGSAAPYRAWAYAVAGMGDLAGARRIIDDGKARVGDSTLAREAASLAVEAGDWAAAADEWLLAARDQPVYLPAASASLARAPDAAHDQILRRLERESDDPTTAWLTADLLVRWERAEEGWTLLDRSLPSDRRQAVMLLQRFVSRTQEIPSAGASRARGFALERLAELASPDAADRLRLEAARAFVDAGNVESALRPLSRVRVPTAGKPYADIAANLVGVLADVGEVDRADSLFRRWSEYFDGGTRARLAVRVARGWVAAGAFDKAEASLGNDSSIAARAVRGWLALYRGDLHSAGEDFRAAGPAVGGRDDATRRAAALVLIERVGRDRFPPLGAAELALAGGDTARAVTLYEQAAGQLDPTAGRADLLARGGDLALRSGADTTAERLLAAALAADSAGPSAPTVEYSLATIYATQGRDALAVQHLEHVILSAPESAVIPLARRLLDRVRGRIPRT